MSRTKRYVKKATQAIKRRRLHAKERHERQQRQAQRDIAALYQALHDLGVPEDLVIEIEGRLRAQKKLLGKIFGLMFPTLFGCALGTTLRPPAAHRLSAGTTEKCSD
jgi:hypothetical protein